MFDLTGRVAIVTGGSRGLGLAMARALGAAGARLVLTARKEAELAEAVAALAAEGIAAEGVPLDGADLAAVPGFVDGVVARHGRIDILINNAGASWGAPAADYPLDAWRKVMAINVDAVFVLSQAVAVKAMLPARRGVIVNIASIAGLGGAPRGAMQTSAYNTAKAAVINLTRSLAGEWGEDGIRVNAIAPGWFPTKMSRGLLSREGEGFLPRIPLGRFGDVDREIGGPALFLVSDAASYITGATLMVDGGLSALV